MDGSTASYTNWMPSEPQNNEGNDERNAAIYDGMWDDAADDNHNRPLCRTGDGNSACRTVYLSGEACSQNFCEAHWGEDWGEEPDREE